MNCLLISSYIGHKDLLDKLLYSIQQMTPNNIEIYIIISSADYNEFQYMLTKYNKMHLLVFSKILEILEDKTYDEDILLKDLGKWKYQSMKKFYGLYYLFFRGSYEHIMIVDSETFIIQKLDLNEYINKYIRNSFIVYSETPTINNKMHSSVDISSRYINDIQNYIGWFLEYYLWIYDKRIFVDFLRYILIKFKKSLLELVKPYQDIFIEVIYQMFIFKNNNYYKYKLINFHDFLRREYRNNLHTIMEYLDMLQPLKPIEDGRYLLEKNIDSSFLDKFYEDYKLACFKPNDTKNSLDFIKKHSCIKICTSEQTDKIYKDYFKNYVNINHTFVSNVFTVQDNVYKLVKNTPKHQEYMWLGYQMEFGQDMGILFELDLQINKLENINNNHKIAFKRHHPSEVHDINFKSLKLREWHKFKFEIRCKKKTKDLFIIIFDDAPKIEVMIRNFVFTYKDISI